MFCMRFVTFLDILQNYIVETIKYYLILFPRTKLSCSTICNAYLGPQTWRTVNYFSLLYLPNSVDGLFLPNVPCLVKTNRFFRTLPFSLSTPCASRGSAGRAGHLRRLTSRVPPGDRAGGPRWLPRWPRQQVSPFGL